MSQAHISLESTVDFEPQFGQGIFEVVCKTPSVHRCDTISLFGAVAV